MIRWWINDRMFIFKWTVPLKISNLWFCFFVFLSYGMYEANPERLNHPGSHSQSTFCDCKWFVVTDGGVCFGVVTAPEWLWSSGVWLIDTVWNLMSLRSSALMFLCQRGSYSCPRWLSVYTSANGACRNGNVKIPRCGIVRFYFSFLEDVYPSCVEIISV